MNVIALPQMFFERCLKKNDKIEAPWAWITITSAKKRLLNTDEMLALFEPNLKMTLPLVFGDISAKTIKNMSDEDKSKECHTLFDKEMAESVIKFVDKVKDDGIKILVVNCEAGVSRSGAIATWTVDYLGLNYEKFRRKNPHIYPNTYVMSILKAFSDMNPDLK